MESIKDLKQLLADSRQRGDEPAVANFAYKLGDLYLERGKRDASLPLLQEAFSLCEKHENPRGSSLVALRLGELFLREGDAEQAATYADHACRFFENEPDPKGRVRAFLLRGDIHWHRSEPKHALPWYGEALAECRRHEDALGTATLLDRIAPSTGTSNGMTRPSRCSARPWPSGPGSASRTDKP